MFCLCSLKRKKSFNVFTVVLIFPQAINVLSSQDVGPSVKSWPDSCYVPHWWGPWLSIDDANFGQKWWHQKWKKGQGSSRPVTGGTGVNGLKKLEIHIWSSGSWGPLYFIETALINTAFLHDLGCLTRWTRTRCNRSHNCSGLGMLVCKHILLYEFVIQNLSERLSQDQ